jgi:hypothetical protein
MRATYAKRIFSLALLLTLAFIWGCGRGRSTVSGKVTYEGKPLVFGIVILAGEDNVPLRGEIDPAGGYTVKDVPYGNVRVAISSPMPRRDREAVKKKELTEEMKKYIKETPKVGRRRERRLVQVVSDPGEIFQPRHLGHQAHGQAEGHELRH